MKKHELIKILDKFDDNATICISADSEGNSFNTVGAAENYLMIGDIYEPDLYEPTCAKDNEISEEEFARIKKVGKNVVVLWP